MAMMTYVTNTFIRTLTGRTKAQWLEMGVLSQTDVGLNLSLIHTGCETEKM